MWSTGWVSTLIPWSTDRGLGGESPPTSGLSDESFYHAEVDCPCLNSYTFSARPRPESTRLRDGHREADRTTQDRRIWTLGPSHG